LLLVASIENEPFNGCFPHSAAEVPASPRPSSWDFSCLPVPNAALEPLVSAKRRPACPPSARIHRRVHHRDHHMRATCALTHTQHSRSLAPHHRANRPWSFAPLRGAACQCRTPPSSPPPPPGSTTECTTETTTSALPAPSHTPNTAAHSPPTRANRPWSFAPLRGAACQCQTPPHSFTPPEVAILSSAMEVVILSSAKGKCA
jgi:hypothetical protein